MMNTGSSRWIAYASSVMPPPTEKNQKWRGTMLFFARSDAIHWTRKRVEKNAWPSRPMRSEEHTSELQSRLHLVCRLLLEKKKKITPHILLLTHSERLPRFSRL